MQLISRTHLEVAVLLIQPDNNRKLQVLARKCLKPIFLKLRLDEQHVLGTRYLVSDFWFAEAAPSICFHTLGTSHLSPGSRHHVWHLTLTMCLAAQVAGIRHALSTKHLAPTLYEVSGTRGQVPCTTCLIPVTCLCVEYLVILCAWYLA